MGCTGQCGPFCPFFHIRATFCNRERCMKAWNWGRAPMPTLPTKYLLYNAERFPSPPHFMILMIQGQSHANTVCASCKMSESRITWSYINITHTSAFTGTGQSRNLELCKPFHTQFHLCLLTVSKVLPLYS